MIFIFESIYDFDCDLFLIILILKSIHVDFAIYDQETVYVIRFICIYVVISTWRIRPY